MLSKEQANVAAESILEPKRAELEAEATRISRLRARPWIVRKLAEVGIGGKWTGVLAVGGFTVGILVGTFVWNVSLPAAWLGFGCGAVAGTYLDRKVTPGSFAVIVISLVAIGMSVWAIASRTP